MAAERNGRQGDGASPAQRLQWLREQVLGVRPEPELAVTSGGWVPDGVPTVVFQSDTEPAEPREARPNWHLDTGRRGIAALVAVSALAAGIGAIALLRARPHTVVAHSAPVTVQAASPFATHETAALVVDVVGKVRRPGLVSLPAGARVADAIRAAGGLLPGASPGLLNLARKVSDGEQVAVAVDIGSPDVSAPSASTTVDLNAASVAQLDALPGVGPVLAQRIVDWRTAHGDFSTVDQLREVSGIGDAKFASIKPHVTV